MRTICIVLLACLLPAFPAVATDFYFHMSWERDVEVTHTMARPGDTLRVFIRVDTLEGWEAATLDNVVFGVRWDCSLTHLESKTLNDDIDVDWEDQAGCNIVSWTAEQCGLRIAAITENVSEHLFRVETYQSGGAGFRLATWCPSFVEPLLYIWQHDDCTGYLGEMFAVGDEIYLDVTTPNDDATWGAVKSLYRAP